MSHKLFAVDNVGVVVVVVPFYVAVVVVVVKSHWLCLQSVAFYCTEKKIS